MIGLLIVLMSPILFLIGMALGVHKREKWEVIEVQKGWPDPPPGKGSWTYKRCAGQGLVWIFYGNENDGVEPYFHGEWWGFWRWWWRNMCHTLKWYVLGMAWWEEGNPYGSHHTDHLRYRFIIGDWETDRGFKLIFTKPRKRTWLSWRPFIQVQFPFGMAFWSGWKRRGQYSLSFKRVED